MPGTITILPQYQSANQFYNKKPQEKHRLSSPENNLKTAPGKTSDFSVFKYLFYNKCHVHYISNNWHVNQPTKLQHVKNTPSPPRKTTSNPFQATLPLVMFTTYQTISISTSQQKLQHLKNMPSPPRKTALNPLQARLLFFKLILKLCLYI